MVNEELIRLIRMSLHAAADPSRAPAMQAYLKSAMALLGLRMPELRKILAAAAREHPPASAAEISATAMSLWQQASFREERYAATWLTGLRPARGQTSLLPLYRHMIVTGAWWDLVDGVSPRICQLLLAHPSVLAPEIRSWSTHQDLWLRRSSIISQLGARDRTDTDLLAQVILANIGDREFFIRKAIGWALRQYARTNPQWVLDFAATEHGRLSPLSRREALKHLG